MKVSALELFELKNDFSERELKQAFRRKLQVFHPDRCQGNSAGFFEIQKAYELLRNPQTKETLSDRKLFEARLLFPARTLSPETHQLFQNLQVLEEGRAV